MDVGVTHKKDVMVGSLENEDFRCLAVRNILIRGDARTCP
jgi:hypothetical protein